MSEIAEQKAEPTSSRIVVLYNQGLLWCTQGSLNQRHVFTGTVKKQVFRSKDCWLVSMKLKSDTFRQGG